MRIAQDLLLFLSQLLRLLAGQEIQSHGRPAGAAAPAALDLTVNTVLAKETRIDVLVNNAGSGSYRAIGNVPLEEGRRQMPSPPSPDPSAVGRSKQETRQNTSFCLVRLSKNHEMQFRNRVAGNGPGQLLLPFGQFTFRVKGAKSPFRVQSSSFLNFPSSENWTGSGAKRLFRHAAQAEHFVLPGFVVLKSVSTRPSRSRAARVTLSHSTCTSGWY